MGKGLIRTQAELDAILARNKQITVSEAGPLPLARERGGVQSSPETTKQGTDTPGNAGGAKKEEKRKSSGETEYELILRRQYPHCRIHYERMTFKLADGFKYTPDFAVEFPDGKLEFHEVKGKYLYKGASKSLTTLSKGKARVAADMYPFRFFICQKVAGNWEITPLKGRVDEIAANQNQKDP